MKRYWLPEILGNSKVWDVIASYSDRLIFFWRYISDLLNFGWLIRDYPYEPGVLLPIILVSLFIIIQI